MEQKKLHDLTIDFLQGKLAEEKELELLNWVKESEANKAKFLEEQNVCSELLSANDNKEVNRQWKRLKRRIENKDRTDNRRQRVIKVSAIAAAFIMGIVLTTVYYTGKQPEPVVHTITTPYGARTHITLPDGSKAWLNAGSELKYSSDFSGSRKVDLTGEAYFDIQKSKVPFMVSTSYGNVQVKGTSFNVKAFREEYLQTTLVNGEVLVTNPFNNKKVFLKPGQQVEIDRSGTNIRKVDTELFTSWKEGKLIFKKEYLPTLAKRLERWYNITIELEDDPRLKDIWYSGTIEMESFSEVMELLEVTAPLKHTYNEDTRVIHIYYSN